MFNVYDREVCFVFFGVNRFGQMPGSGKVPNIKIIFLKKSHRGSINLERKLYLNLDSFLSLNLLK